MRGIRDFVLMLCAVISTACLVYFVFHIENLKTRLATPGGMMSLLPDDPESTILKRLKRPPSN